ncbi:glycosyltransferase [Xanthobacteraceae bacterium A53D]
MSPVPEGRRARILHFDVDSFSFEGFSNGATIQYREMLRRFQARGIDCAVVTIGQAASSIWAARRPGPHAPRWHMDQGIAVGEYLLDHDPVSAPAPYGQMISRALAETHPDLVIVHTPPARLEEAELALFEILATTRTQHLCFVPDGQFPAPGRAAPERLARLQAALAAFDIVAPSRFITEAATAAGLGPCRLFANVFDPRAILAGQRSPDLVTFINPHPMKGVDIFLEIARRLPHRRFQVVRAWPYPPHFSCDLPNVEVRPYTARMAEIWARTAVLIVPSLCPEGFGRIVVEAQLNGIPVIAHAMGGLPEAGGDAAILVPPPTPTGDPVLPRITQAERDRSANAFCAHIEAVFAGSCDDTLARRQAQNWVRRGERDVERLAAPFVPSQASLPSLLVLAPHADDAAFSVGGLMRAWRGPKTVLTIFGRSNFILAEAFTADPDGVSALRKAEDEAYCGRVGARLIHWDLPEAAMRRAPCWEAIFGRQPERFSSHDKEIGEEFAARLAAALQPSPDLLLIPAALGGHADHLLVRDVALSVAAGIPHAFYEDLPYATDLSEDEIEAAIAAPLRAPTLTFVPLIAGIAAKIEDSACYPSQIDRAVQDALARHARRWPALCERLWSADPVMPVIARALAGAP